MNRNQQLDLLLHWARNTKRAQFCHYRMSNTNRRRYTLIGITVTIIAGLGGSAFLANLQKHYPQFGTELSIGIGLLLMLAALLSAIQTLLRLDERAHKHLTAATRYGAAKRHIGQLVASVRSEIDSTASIDGMRKTLDALAAESPQIPDSLLQRTEKSMPPTPFDEYYPEQKTTALQHEK